VVRREEEKERRKKVGEGPKPHIWRVLAGVIFLIYGELK